MPSISFLLLALFTLLITLSSSSPSLLPRQSPQQYYLRTAIVPSEDVNDTGTYRGDLYIQPYHTGAGLNDVTLTSNISEALSGALNTTIDPTSGERTWITSIPAIITNGEETYWEMCARSPPYTNWGYMQINLGEPGCNYFYADGDLLMCTAGEWLVCDWWHGITQLFFVTPGEADGAAFQAPSSCSVVDLQMVLADEEGEDGS